MVQRAKDTWAHICLTYRKTILLLLAAITAFACSQLPNLEFDNAMDIWFLDDDPTYVAHQRMLDTFVSDETIVIGLEAPDVFAPEVLEIIDRVTRGVEKAPHVEKVFSLTDIEAVEGRDDVLEIDDLIKMPVDPAALPAIRKRALANELYVGNIVSAGGDFAVIIARLPHIADDFDYKIEAMGGINAVLDSEPDTRFFVSGGPPIDYEFYKLSAKDNMLLTTLITIGVTGALWFLLGNISAVVLAIATVILSAIWAHAWIAVAGSKTNMVTTMLPGLLIAVGVADSMHVLVEYQNKLRVLDDKFDALRAVYHDLMSPLALTTLTTAIGMLSLTVSKVAGIRDFGIFAAIGVYGAFLLSITMVPIVLSYLPKPNVQSSRLRNSARSQQLLHRLHELTMDHGQAIAIGSGIVIAISLVGGSRVEAESKFVEMFPEDHIARIDTRRIEDALSGVVTMEILIDSGKEGGIKEPETLQRIVALQKHLEKSPYVSATQSIADHLKDMRRAFHSNDQKEYRLPDTREEAAQYLLLYEMDAPDGDLWEMATYDYRETRISARVVFETSNIAYALVQDTQRWLDENLTDSGMSGQVTGMVSLYSVMETYIRNSLILGFSIAMVLIFAIFCIQLRSIGLGAIAMIPNVAPIVVSLGVMGFAGINLDSMTCMVASIAIGLAVDDSIHFISRIRRRLFAGTSMRESLAEATVEVGRALVYTSITLCFGFGAMMFATFVGIFYFGLLCTITVAFALIADLLLLPVVFRWYSGLGGSAVPVDSHSAVHSHAPGATPEAV